jgi:hypothetical protein
MPHNDSIPRLFLSILALVLFLLGSALWWTVPDSPYRLRIISAGLFCWLASTFF